MSAPAYDRHDVAARLRQVAERVRDHTLGELRARSPESLSAVAHESPADTIYAIDREVEDVLLPALDELLAPTVSFVLVCEGLEEGPAITFPRGTAPERCAARVIVDPIDGTRGLMYAKRSAWVLAAVAPNRGEATALSDLDVAVQAEIPTARAALADVLWAVRGEGAQGETLELATGQRRSFQPRPSRATDLRGGFAALARYFPAGKAALAALEEELLGGLGLLDDRATTFEDQYISTGGQLYELMVGHDRFVADLRSVALPALSGVKAPLCCHPYDACTALIAREAGVEVTDGRGRPLDAPLDTTTGLSWIGYANRTLRRQIEGASPPQVSLVPEDDEEGDRLPLNRRLPDERRDVGRARRGSTGRHTSDE